MSENSPSAQYLASAPPPTVKRFLSGDLFSYLGIVVMTLLIGVAVVVGIYNMKHIQKTGEFIVQERIERIQFVQTMGIAARERTVLLQRMMMVDDPFQRDKLSEEFNRNGSAFANARILLLKQELSDEERLMLDLQGSATREAVPLQNKIVDLIQANAMTEAKELLNSRVIPLQDKVLAHLSELLKYQNDAAKASVEQTRYAYEQGRTITLVMAISAMFIAVYLLWLARKAAIERREYLAQVHAANHAKSAFLAKMSHEIRTPLTAIIGFAEVSLDSDQTMEERVRALRTIQQSGKHLLHIINDILDLSKVEAEKLEIEHAQCSLFQLLADVENLEKMPASDKGLTFGINYQFPLPKFVVTDPLRFKQIIINLCSNAIKFTEKGYVYVNVSYDRSREALVIEIADSGLGLTPEEQSRLFQDFQQADAGIARRYGGTGLGLSVSQRLAELLGGRITVTSQKGVGSKFKFTLPQPEKTNELVYALSEIEVIRSSMLRATARPQSRFIGKVLVAEDTPEIADLICMYLRRAGVKYVKVDNGQQAIDRVEQERFDAILMDIQMPIVDGVTAIRTLRAKGCTIPTVAVTANAMKADQDFYKEAGFIDFVGKPIDRNALYQVLEKHLEREPTDAQEKSPLYSEIGDNEGDEEYQRLVDGFVEKLPEYFSKLSYSATQGDWRGAHEIAHKLKGLGGGMGYPSVSEIAATAMTHIKNENYRGASDVVAEMGHLISRIQLGRRQPAPTTP